jgi:hypothetical protein
MSEDAKRETTGAWIIHHGRKLALDANGASEFSAIDEAAKAASLLARLGGTDEATLSLTQVRAIAVAGGLNPRHELSGLLDVLRRRRLIDQGGDSVHVLGVTTRSALTHAVELFEDAEPTLQERAALDLGEWVSREPVPRHTLHQIISDTYQFTDADTSYLLDRSEGINFVDSEGDGAARLLFNGNLFRRDTVNKTAKILQSLSSAEEAKVKEVGELLKTRGCASHTEVEKILCSELLHKLHAAGLFDFNIVGNETGDHCFVTAPAAFHKFVSPLVDDSFDMAKALVAALTYGMTTRPSNQGRIDYLPQLLRALIRGSEVGPASAIGQDYRVLEVSRVVALRPDARYPDRFYMSLKKCEIGELALQVLTTGTAAPDTLTVLPEASMTHYTPPEAARANFRKQQSKPSRRQTLDVLQALRGGREFK